MAHPDDWKVKTLDEVSTVTSGKRLPLGSQLVDNPTSAPYIRVTDMRPGTVALSNIKYVPDDIAPLIDRYRIFSEDIFISVAGSLGIAGKVPTELDGANLTENADRITNISCSRDYLLQVLMSPLTQKAIDAIRTVGAQPKLALEKLRKFVIPLPPNRSEQDAIASALDEVDSLVAGLDRLIAKKRDLKQAAMQQLLTGKVRLPGFRTQWAKRSLGELGRCLRGVGYRADIDLFPHDLPNTKRLLRSNNIQESIVRTTDIQFVSSERVTPDQVLQRSDILICMANGSRALVGKAGLFQVRDGYDYTFGAFMGCFRTHSSEAKPEYLFYLFQTERYRDYINNLLAGSAINNLSPSSIESLEFLMPSIDEQAAVAFVLSDMDGELAALEARRSKTQALKQAMMQELLTGRIRLI